MSAESTDKLTAAIDRLTDAGYPTNDIAPLVSARDNLKGWTAGGHPTTSLLIDGVTNLVALLAEHEDLCKREHQMSARLTQGSKEADR